MTIPDVLFFLIFATGIVYIALWRFKQYRIDKFRQNVFSVRDKLFDYAAAGNISFSHPAYVSLRSMLNGYIRFSHRISLFGLIIHSKTLVDGEEPRFQTIWIDATSELDEKTKMEMENFLIAAATHLFYFIFLSSLLKKIVVGPLMIAFTIKYASKEKSLKAAAYDSATKGSRQVSESIDHLNADAFVFGNTSALPAT